MPAEENFEIRDKEIEKLLRNLGQRIGKDIPNGFGFTLFIFSYTNPLFIYISSANREDMIKTLVEFIEKNGYIVQLVDMR